MGALFLVGAAAWAVVDPTERLDRAPATPTPSEANPAEANLI
jgi:hypothetical protein